MGKKTFEEFYDGIQILATIYGECCDKPDVWVERYNTGVSARNAFFTEYPEHAEGHTVEINIGNVRRVTIKTP